MPRQIIIRSANADYNGMTFGVQFTNGIASVIDKGIDPRTEKPFVDRYQRTFDDVVRGFEDLGGPEPTAFERAQGATRLYELEYIGFTKAELFPAPEKPKLDSLEIVEPVTKRTRKAANA